MAHEGDGVRFQVFHVFHVFAAADPAVFARGVPRPPDAVGADGPERRRIAGGRVGASAPDAAALREPGGEHPPGS